MLRKTIIKDGIVTLRHTPEQVQRSRAAGIVCARTIDASNDVLAAAGLLTKNIYIKNADLED